MDDDDFEYLGFWQMLAIAVAPAVVEHLLAPLLFRQVDPEDVKPPTPERKRSRAKAAARGFAAFVTHERSVH